MFKEKHKILVPPAVKGKFHTGTHPVTGGSLSSPREGGGACSVLPEAPSLCPEAGPCLSLPRADVVPGQPQRRERTKRDSYAFIMGTYSSSSKQILAYLNLPPPLSKR